MSDLGARAICFAYTNYRGERSVRTAMPLRLYWGSTEYHPRPQWIMRAYDLDKGADRDFALSDCNFSDLGMADTPMVAVLADQIAFSARTFGPGRRTAGMLDHIRKELTEIEADPSDITEWIDVAILAFDGAWRHARGAHSAELPEDEAATLAALVTGLYMGKLLNNKARDWPDWRTADPDKAIEHIRGAGPQERAECDCPTPTDCETRGCAALAGRLVQ